MRRARTLAAAAAAAIAFGAAACWKRDALLDRLLDLRYGASVPLPPGPAPRDAVEARRQDLDYLAHLPEVDRSFAPAARERFTAEVARLRAGAASLDDGTFFLGVAAAVALADNAHTNVDAVSWRRNLDSAPVRLAWFPEGLYVVAATEEQRTLLGARVLDVGGLDPPALERAMRRFVGGTREYVHSLTPLLAESPQALHALRAESPEGLWSADLEDGEGRRRHVALAAIAAGEAPPATKPGRLLSPLTAAAQRPGRWLGLLQATDALAPSLRGPQSTVYATPLGSGVLYVHLWQVRDEARGSLERDVRAALGPEAALPWRRIVLDLRFDAGGDYPTVYGATRAIGRRLAPDGRLAILEDDTTFSAAIIAAVLARHFAGPRAVLVGERPGDRLAFWSEGTPMTLPHSRIRIGVSTGFHDWQNGCRALRCYWPNFFYDVAGGSVEPRVPVAWTFADYRRGVDTVLQRALE